MRKKYAKTASIFRSIRASADAIRRPSRQAESGQRYRAQTLSVAVSSKRERMTTNLVGVIYLLHFDEKYEHAQHYVGFCEQYSGLDSRFEYHAKGNGSKLLAAVSAAGIDFKLVRLWEGTRNDERAIKNCRQAMRYCPVCQAKPYRRRGLKEMDV